MFFQNKKIITLFCLISLSAVSCFRGGLLTRSQEQGGSSSSSRRDPFPLTKGNYWIYSGTVKWQDGGAISRISKKKIIWKMEVVDSLKRGGVSASLLLGHPSDLVFYKEGRKRRYHTILKKGNRYYFDVNWKRVKDKRVKIDSLLRNENLFLDFPLSPGKTFGGSGALREDHLYTWLVESKQIVSLEHTKNIDPSVSFEQFGVSYRSNPDFTAATFVKGVGITRYLYFHHGSHSELDLHLSEVRIFGMTDGN